MKQDSDARINAAVQLVILDVLAERLGWSGDAANNLAMHMSDAACAVLNAYRLDKPKPTKVRKK